MGIDPLSIVGGILGGAITMLLGDALRRKIWGARVLLDFADTPEYIVDTNHFSDLITPIPDPRHNDPTRTVRVSRRDYRGAKYARIKVSNGGFECARNVSGYLTDFQYWNGARFCPTCYRDNIPLCWSYFNPEGPQKLDVLRGVPHYLDVFSTDEGDKQFSLRFQSHPIAYKELFKIDAGRLRFTIVVAAENTSPEKLVFELDWRGKWNDFNMSRIE